jgi:hypothetical protein
LERSDENEIKKSRIMRPEFILMLTYNDQTVANALDLFNENQDLPVIYWGFKDVGLPADKMLDVVEAMKNANKTTFLEVVSLTEEEGLAGAKLAVELGFDILMGTVFFDTINDFMNENQAKYFPFPGHVHSHPSILDGSIEDIVEDARMMEAKGVAGMDLLTYRYIGDARRLLKDVVSATEVPIVSAGSIDSFQRLAEVWEASAWGFTIGTALFEKRFIPDGSFRENILAVCNWLDTTTEAELLSYVS